MIFVYIILLTALTLSTVSAYYSIAGLVAIFSAAPIPIMIMGGALEVGKIVATVFLHNNWKRLGLFYKSYLVPAVIFLMILTSVGVFGLLSKAHSDQSLVSGDATSRVAIYDEKIQTAKGNIDANRKALKQMDEAVDQVMGRSQDEKGADKAVAIRRGQQKERVRLLAEITAEQKTISQLSEERAPLAAEVRKVEADVGPVKYIAALIYGDNPDQNVLERAVRWVIILIVIVFDPLALCLILASNKQLEWVREDREKPEEPAPVYVADVGEPPTAEEVVPVEEPEPVAEVAPAYEADDGPITENIIDQIQKMASEELPTGKVVTVSRLFDEELTCYKCGTVLADAAGIGPFCPNKECDVIDNWDTKQELPVDPHPPGWMYDELKSHPLMEEAEIKEITVEPEPALTEEQLQFLEQAPALIEELSEELTNKESELASLQTDYNQLEENSLGSLNRNFALTQELDQLKASMEQMAAVMEELEAARNVELQRANNLSSQLMDALHPRAPAVPDLSVTADNVADLKTKPNSSFGIEFPPNPNKGDLFLRTDYLPTKLFKFNSDRWFELDKTNTDSYAYNDSYLEYLVEKLRTGEYDQDDLSEVEHEQIAQYLQGKNGIK